MNSNTLVRLLQDTPFFGGINDDTVQLILDSSNKVIKNKNDYFFKEKEIGESMFVLISGSVKVVKYWHGDNYPINTLFAGDCFGEMAIVEHNTRSASVIAQEKCVALEIPNHTFLDLYQSNVKQFALLQMNMSREISRRLRSVNERLFSHYIHSENVVNHEHVY